MIDLSYTLQRAEQEAILSVAAQTPAAAAIHDELCLLYSLKALEALTKLPNDIRAKIVVTSAQLE